LTAKGEVLRCRWRSVPLRTRKGALIGIFSLAQDVTAELLAAEHLLAGKESAERLSQAKSEFLAVVGHELRTPLNGILGMAQLLQVYELDDEVQGYLQTINDSGQNLLLIINAIMRYADADRGSQSAAVQLFSLTELLLFGTQVFEFQASQKGLAFELSLDPALPEMVAGDEEALKSIVANLGENAVRFTENGSIQIAARLLARHAAHCDVEISVQDTGVGMSPEFMEGLYQPFRQAENAIVRKHGGVGLGLALVRKLVDRIGGEISVISTPGKGSTLTLHCSLKLLPPED
jgi:signal transduction histidine kinase